MQIKTTIQFDQLARIWSNKDYNNIVGNLVYLLTRADWLRKLNIVTPDGPAPGS